MGGEEQDFDLRVPRRDDLGGPDARVDGLHLDIHQNHVAGDGVRQGSDLLSGGGGATTSISLWAETTSQKSSRSRGKSSATITRIVFAIV